MKQRARYAPVWHSLPGTVAAYQPIGAPDHLRARWNVGMWQARTGQNNARLGGAAPTWGPATGWTFNGSTQYLDTDIIPPVSNRWSALVQFSGATNSASDKIIFGSVGASGDTRFFIESSYSNQVVYGRGFYRLAAPGLLAGNLGVAYRQGYRNGVADAAAILVDFSSIVGGPIEIGAAYIAGAGAAKWNGTIQALSIYDRRLSDTEMLLCAQQMKYCHSNNDWSAWGRQRQWYLAPVEEEIEPILALWAGTPALLPGRQVYGSGRGW